MSSLIGDRSAVTERAPITRYLLQTTDLKSKDTIINC